MSVPGIKVTQVYDKLTGEMTFIKSQDVAPILNENESAYNNAPSKGNRFKKVIQEVACIPTTLISEWKRQGIDIYNKDDEAKIKKILNDRDFRKLRSHPGTI